MELNTYTAKTNVNTLLLQGFFSITTKAEINILKLFFSFFDHCVNSSIDRKPFSYFKEIFYGLMISHFITSSVAFKLSYYIK